MNLKNNPILYADIINALALDAHVLYEDDNAICIRDTYSEIVYVAALQKRVQIGWNHIFRHVFLFW